MSEKAFITVKLFADESTYVDIIIEFIEAVEEGYFPFSFLVEIVEFYRQDLVNLT